MPCTRLLQQQGKPYPRTCAECGLGPCKQFGPIISEANPEHPVTQGMREHWHKVLALFMHRQGVKEFVLGPEDMSPPPGGLNIVALDNGGVLTIRVVDDAEASRLASGG